MKRSILTLGLILMFAVPCMGADGDFSLVEVRPDVAAYALDTFTCRVFTQTCVVTYRKVDSNGDSVGDEVTVIFQNVEDDPATVEDETDTSFTDLITAINSGSNIRVTLKNAVKLKLGL